MSAKPYESKADFSSAPYPPQEDLQSIIQQGDAELMVLWAERIGKVLARQMTTSQIRNIFGTARQIEMGWTSEPEAAKASIRQLMLMKPRLAYQARRERGKGIEILKDILIPAIDLVGGSQERFRYFVDFFEAILAYHTAYGGK
jgi:CRISPR-associated protein Csm2